MCDHTLCIDLGSGLSPNSTVARPTSSSLESPAFYNGGVMLRWTGLLRARTDRSNGEWKMALTFATIVSGLYVLALPSTNSDHLLLPFVRPGDVGAVFLEPRPSMALQRRRVMMPAVCFPTVFISAVLAGHPILVLDSNRSYGSVALGDSNPRVKRHLKNLISHPNNHATCVPSTN